MLLIRLGLTYWDSPMKIYCMNKLPRGISPVHDGVDHFHFTCS